MLFNNFGSAQAAVDSAIASLHAAVTGFDKIANDLVIQYQDDQVVQGAVRSFVDACRCNCTGNLNWRLVYNLRLFLQMSTAYLASFTASAPNAMVSAKKDATKELVLRCSLEM